MSEHKHVWLYQELPDDLAQKHGVRFRAECVDGKVPLADDDEMKPTPKPCDAVKYEHALPPGYRPLENWPNGFMFDPKTLAKQMDVAFAGIETERS